mmetsp:Transcript_57757/g.95837  ORF Transcript_57757/g.95837 Transcript_57757/m.95837 type:complete len:211 (-) Transcript_57757:232-864(-)|eukprot:CAMPEP_0202712956 /NCGR_PEP_ID=MMETSP1385-20130828/47592_1 /ASSEMBLY_ACC=CAM_ASM_000861 /TAXON_ID=933848 /ORGANISM="Elphidium margaritaceum" /LENGTH=210 /DNA_ID=CAMNT_0049373157 /DNA_START=140 /DNA_END=772 /DNA_ORIENTATION=-
MTSYQLPKCLIIDARDHILGRLASTVAKHLMMGTKIIVLRCERIVMSGHHIRNKLKMKSFRGHRMNTNPSRGPFHYCQPSRVFYRVVRGMIPHKTPKGKKTLSLLHCYDGMPPRYQHVRKVRLITAYKALRLDPNRAQTVLGRLCTEFGWNKSRLMIKLEDKRKIKQKQVYTIQKEIGKLKKQAIANVSQTMKKQYEFLTQFEWELPLQA